MISFQYYPANIKNIKPIGIVTLEQFIQSTIDPKIDTYGIFQQIKKQER
jgi:hypothetical protein